MGHRDTPTQHAARVALFRLQLPGPGYKPRSEYNATCLQLFYLLYASAVAFPNPSLQPNYAHAAAPSNTTTHHNHRAQTITAPNAGVHPKPRVLGFPFGSFQAPFCGVRWASNYGVGIRD